MEDIRNLIEFKRGKSVYIRPFELEDINDSGYREWINDSENIKYLDASAFPHSKEELINYYKMHIGNKTMYLFAIVEGESRNLVGTIRLYGIDMIHKTAWKGTLIGKEYQEKGYATDATRLLIDFAFNSLNLRKIKSGTLISNKAIQSINKKLGFKKEGLAKKERFFQGKYHDVIYWGLLNVST